jgi:hypothetical protein
MFQRSLLPFQSRCSILKKEAGGSSKLLVLFYQTTCCNFLQRPINLSHIIRIVELQRLIWHEKTSVVTARASVCNINGVWIWREFYQTRCLDAIWFYHKSMYNLSYISVDIIHWYCNSIPVCIFHHLISTKIYFISICSRVISFPWRRLYFIAETCWSSILHIWLSAISW